MEAKSTPCVCRSCECEHVAHFDTTARTPYGNPSHNYGQKFHLLTPCKTPHGTFHVCPDCARDCYNEFPSLAFTHEGVDFWRCTKLGAFFGLSTSKRDVLEITMMADGSPETRDFGNGKELAVGEVTNLDEDFAVLDLINSVLGTNFPMSHFPGR